MRPPPYYVVDYFLAQLKEDFEELLGHFQHTGSVRYEAFSAIWREMGFPHLYYGIPAMNEMRKFCLIAMSMATKYLMPIYSFQIQVGALYLLYGLYHTQLVSPPEKIRIALKDWPHIQKLLQDSIRSQHYDIVYILQKLIADKAVSYTAMPEHMTFVSMRMPQKVVFELFRARAGLVVGLVSTETLEELENIRTQYEKLKKVLLEKSCQLSVSQQDLPALLQRCVEDFLQWQDTRGFEKKAVPPEVRTTERALLLASIKSHSYSSYQESKPLHRHVETQQSSVMAQQLEHTPPRRKRRKPPSLRSRTWKKLGVEKQQEQYQPWLLTPSQEEHQALKRTGQKRAHLW